MDITQACGLAVVCLSTITIAFVAVRKYEIDCKYNFNVRTSKEYKKLRKEADQWRMLYEEQRALVTDLKAKLRLRDIIYGKVKVKDYADLHAGKRTEKAVETQKHE